MADPITASDGASNPVIVRDTGGITIRPHSAAWPDASWTIVVGLFIALIGTSMIIMMVAPLLNGMRFADSMVCVMPFALIAAVGGACAAVSGFSRLEERLELRVRDGQLQAEFASPYRKRNRILAWPIEQVVLVDAGYFARSAQDVLEIRLEGGKRQSLLRRAPRDELVEIAAALRAALGLKPMPAT